MGSLLPWSPIFFELSGSGIMLGASTSKSGRSLGRRSVSHSRSLPVTHQFFKKPIFFWEHNFRLQSQGCQIFHGTTLQHIKNIYQITPKIYIPHGHKIYQMAENRPNGHKYSIARPSKIYPNRDFWCENMPSGNPVQSQTKRITIELLRSMSSVWWHLRQKNRMLQFVPL
jgi:hypothetical protein